MLEESSTMRWSMTTATLKNLASRCLHTDAAELRVPVRTMSKVQRPPCRLIASARARSEE